MRRFRLPFTPWRRWNVAAAIAATLAFAGASQSGGEARVVSIGGAVTEIVYALGQEHRLVARDSTSNYPAEAMELPDVGYMRALSPEGVLSVNPELILAVEGSGPPEAIEVLRGADIPLVEIPEAFSAENIAAKIRAVGAALGVPAEAEALAAEVGAELEDARAAAAAAAEAPKRVLFILSIANGRILASGEDTAADGMIRMAGGVNALAGFTGYKPLTDEAASTAAPDVILMMDRSGDHGATADELFALPAIATTPAAGTRALVKMDGLYLLGFGPRTASAIRDLNRALYGEAE